MVRVLTYNLVGTNSGLNVLFLVGLRFRGKVFDFGHERLWCFLLGSLTSLFLSDSHKWRKLLMSFFGGGELQVSLGVN